MSNKQRIRHFLLVFDHEEGRLLDQTDFGEDCDAALKAYGEREEELSQQPRDRRRRIEIVLIGSDSIETVKLTHANYFDGSVAVSKYFEAAGLR